MKEEELIEVLSALLRRLGGFGGSEAQGFKADVLEVAVDFALGPAARNAEWKMAPLQSIFSSISEGSAEEVAFIPSHPLHLELLHPQPNKPNLEVNLQEVSAKLNKAKSIDQALLVVDFYLSNCALSDHPKLRYIGVARQFRLILGLYGSLVQSDQLLFIGGDLSGVQSYLYNIISSGAAKNLKGRSFYLQLLTENFLHLFLEKAALNPAHLVYNSGGSFYILGPDTEQVNEALKELSERVHSAMYREHGTELFMAIEKYPFNASILKNKGTATEVWQALAQNLSKAKGQRYKELIQKDFDLVFGIKEVSSNRLDAITGEVIEPGDSYEKLKENVDGEPQYVLAKTNAQIELAKNLNRAEYWNISTAERELIDGFDRPGLGLINRFKQAATGRNLKLNYPNPEEEWFLFGGNAYPKDESDQPISFDKLVELGPESGIPRLGVLRMDVDNLGMLFKSGLGDQSTFAGFAELSFRLDQFFKGHLNVLRDRSPVRQESTYIVYSGGDDLFLVGQWSELMELAMEIRKEFGQWTAHNTKLTLSGGLVLVRPRFPIAKAAEMAGEYENLAKDFVHPVSGAAKNAFTLFGIPFSWDELEEVCQWRDFWQQNLSAKTVSHSFLYRLYQFMDQKNSTGSERFSWQWNASYLLARQRKDRRMAEDQYQTLLQLIVNGKGNYRALDLACIGARWAELLIR